MTTDTDTDTVTVTDITTTLTRMPTIPSVPKAWAEAALAAVFRHMRDYLKNPQAIYARSFELVREATCLERFPAALHPLVLRLVHACAMPDIADDLAFSAGAAEAGVQALAAGAPIFADGRMTAEGVIREGLPAGNEVLCTLDAPGVADAARARNTTRAAAAVDLWLPRLGGAVVAIGNAPTALFHLLELLDDGAPKPALVLGFPVGFVGAAESKDALMESSERLGLAFACLRGLRGGSAMAAAAVNALASGGQQSEPLT